MGLWWGWCPASVDSIRAREDDELIRVFSRRREVLLQSSNYLCVEGIGSSSRGATSGVCKAARNGASGLVSRAIFRRQAVPLCRRARAAAPKARFSSICDQPRRFLGVVCVRSRSSVLYALIFGAE